MANNKKKAILSTNGNGANLNPEDVKSDFITIASHQLRTPISAIRWSLDTLLSGRTGELSDKQREVVNEAYQNNKFMVKVVNDLLRVSRFEEKGISLLPQPTNLTKIFEELIKIHQDLAQASNCQIIIQAEKIPKAYIDPLQIKPVIHGLIDNAIRYSKGKGKIQIILKPVKNYILVKIQDNGIGIPQAQQTQVFTKFFRGSNAMKAQTEGLGLDLYLAKNVIELSGGKIEFTSHEDKGTTFNLYFPTSKKQVESRLKIAQEDPQNILKKEREFVSITVHELKAPLGITKWSLEMLKSQKSGPLTNDQLSLIDQIYRGNERLLVLVRDLLNLAKLQEGKFEIEPRLIQFEEVVSDVVNGFTVEAQKKTIKLEWQKSKQALPKILADPSRVAQVVTNLVSNAIKYTPKNGQVIISLQLVSASGLKKIGNNSKTININFSDNKKGYLVLAVRDTGIGISEEDQNKMFTKFFRSKKVLKSEAEGTGLGLYITKSIVNLHKGDILFESKLGKGSIFYFSLPIA